MKKLMATLALLLPLLSHADVKADIAQVDKDLETCLASEEGQSNMGMKECTGTAFDSADKILNVLYKAKVAELSKSTGDKEGDSYNKEILNRLKVSQRAWVAFRDSNSSLASTEMLGGTGEGLVYIDSLYSMTKSRVLELDSILNMER